MRIAKETLDTMMKQITLDCNLEESIQIADRIFLAPSKANEGARLINGMDLFMKVIVFMGRAYIMADESILGGCEDFFRNIKPEWMFEFFTLRKIDYILGTYEREIVDTHIYYLPAEGSDVVKEKGNEIWLNSKDIEEFRNNNLFPNALGFSPTQPDEIAVMIKDGNKPIAMAGASIDGKYVRQIGIDVLKEYRHEGLATHLVTLLKQQIISEGNLPFYGTSESHALSRNIAIQSGFLPAFSEFFVAKMINHKHNETQR